MTDFKNKMEIRDIKKGNTLDLETIKFNGSIFKPLSETDVLDSTYKSGMAVICNNETDITITIPKDTTYKFPIAHVIDFIKYNTGNITFVGENGVTINSVDSLLSLATQYSGASILIMGDDEWLLGGALT